MSTFKRVKSELFEGKVEGLRRVIEAHRSFEATPVERPFDEKWATELKHKIVKGLAVSFHWAVADMPLDGKQVRLRANGNHSSWALHQLLLEKKLPDDLAIHLDTYFVPDQDAAVQLFRQFDSRKSARTKEDVSGAYQCFQEAIRNCNRRVAKLAVEGYAWYRRELDELPVSSGDDLYELFNDSRLHPFIQMLDRILDSKCSELKRVPIIAAAYGTWRDDAKAAEDFWRRVSLGSKRGVEDAASDLDDELVRIKDEKVRVSAGDLYARCAKAWEANKDSKRVTSFKVNTKQKGLPVIAA